VLESLGRLADRASMERAWSRAMVCHLRKIPHLTPIAFVVYRQSPDFSIESFFPFGT